MTNKTYTLTITSGEKSFTTENIISLDGFYAPSFDVKLSSHASRIGHYPTRRSYSERILTVCFEISGKNAESERRQLISLLDPKKDLTLSIKKGDTTRKATVIPYGEIKLTAEEYAGICECEISFVAPDIFFEAVTNESYTSPSGSAVSVYNPGEVSCGAVFTLTATGEVKTPAVRLGSYYVKCPITMAEGDTLEIDTREGRKNVSYNGNTYYGFNSGSTFFSLPTESSDIRFTATSGSEYISAQIVFTPLYYGI